MIDPTLFTSQLAAFPPALRRLIKAELAAGNEVVEISSCFPAPPAGAYARLARPVSTRARKKTKALDFYDRNSSIYSGEWTDAKRYYFVIEPPNPPPPEPDMDAIRDARNAAAAQPAPAPKKRRQPASRSFPPSVSVYPRSSVGEGAESIVRRFEKSMTIDYEKWHDGIGYEVDLLEQATSEELKSIEQLLLTRGISDWRDVEAIARLKSARAKSVLKQAMTQGKTEIKAAVIRHAPELVCADDKDTFLIEALRTADFYGGLSQALEQIETNHPPAVVEELFRGALNRKDRVAVHFAAMLMFIHGKAPEAFDWEQRPFFLRFATDNRAEREAVFRELCAKLGVSAEPFFTAR